MASYFLFFPPPVNLCNTLYQTRSLQFTFDGGKSIPDDLFIPAKKPDAAGIKK